MSSQKIQFLLVPDSSAARRIRRVLVEEGARSGVLVGTWLELLEYARTTYLLPLPDKEWNEVFHNGLCELENAFWAKSYLISPQETASAVESSYCEIITATDIHADFKLPELDQLSSRLQNHLDDFVSLNTVLKSALPAELEIIKALIQSDAADALQQIRVYCVEGSPALSQWQLALVSKLNQDAGDCIDPSLQDLLNRILSTNTVEGKQNSLLMLQGNLFQSPESLSKLDSSVQWIGVRDFLEEAEIAAGMVQTMLSEHKDLTPADIGLLLPDSFEYSVAVDDAFSKAGLAVSGLPVDRWQRDLGREAVFHFLYCRRKPAQAMALAVCLSSPLMPWPFEEGADLAQGVMDGNYRLRPFHSASDNDREMLDLIRDGDEKPKTLVQALHKFVTLLNSDEGLSEHLRQAKSTVDSLCAMLLGMKEIDWTALHRAATPKMITTGNTPDYNLEGITILRESHEPWRRVKKLLVLGFSAGNYPVSPGASAVFTGDDLLAIRERLGLLVDSPANLLMRKRERFKRQLAAATDFITFFIPRRGADGAAQLPSESLVFMHQLFEAVGNESDDMVLELDSASDRKHVRYLAEVGSERPITPREIISEDIQFDSDLLALRVDADGNQKPESPSGMETLMVSRLAWLLRRLYAEPLGWAPESPGVMLLGTLAHQVFEELFQSGQPIPKADEIRSKVSGLLDDAIKQHGPFLRAAQWQVERKHLATGIIQAAVSWSDLLLALNAEVLGSEIWLEGKLNDVPIHGQADVLLGLPEGRLLVVDYKRSSSNSRRPRMQKGYDSQASLYRTMLQTGGPKDKENKIVNDRLSKSTQTGIVYYTLNDQTALSDTVLTESDSLPGWEALENNISEFAIELIRRRLKEVQQGQLCLNREGDESFFDRTAGVKPYALDSSPLISLFTLLGDAVEAE